MPFVWDSREVKNPVVDGVTPHNRLRRLILEPGKDVAITLVVHVAPQHLPLLNEILRAVRALIVRIVNVLNHGLARVEDVAVGHMMEEQQEIVGTRGK